MIKIAEEKKSLVGGFTDLLGGVVIGGAAIGVIGGSTGLPAPLRTGLSSLIGVRLVKGATDLIDEDLRFL